MPAPSREELDVTIDQIAADIISALDLDKPGTVPASSFSALSAAGAFLLAYRAQLPGYPSAPLSFSDEALRKLAAMLATIGGPL